MSRIATIFRQLRAEGRTGLMPFVTGGYPSLRATEEALPALQQAGAHIVEIGIPFSDPIADGPVIAQSMHLALEAGVTPTAIFDTVRSARPSLSLGLVAMVSTSIVTKMGKREFISQACRAGFDGLIVPDADTDGGASSPAGRLARAAEDEGLTCSFLIAPTTTPARLKSLASISSGFVYVLARVGITGERDEAPQIVARIAAVRQATELPIAVGFGIARPEHAQAVAQHADAVIIGSALVRRMGESPEPVKAAVEFIASIAAALRSREAPL